MKIVAEYDFNNGKTFITANYTIELQEIVSVINGVDANRYKTKESKEKTMPGAMLFAPSELNTAFEDAFHNLNWSSKRISCEYTYGKFLSGYIPPSTNSSRPFREMDFLKPQRKIGVEVQFGKYAFMVYNVCAKMTIFKNLDVIDAGVEIVPVKRFADKMSTGVSYFEQIAWDLEKRGVSDIDIPVLILGIDA